MKIGLLVTSISNFGQKGFYNAQEIGLAKSLDSTFAEVKVYKLVPSDQKMRTEKISGCKNATIRFIPAKNFGINGIIDTSILDKDLDVLLYFSDTQFSVPKVYKWSQKNKVQLLPYIGVIESHSTNRIKKVIVDFLFDRNLKVYRNSHCLVKTPTVARNLFDFGISNITVTPVGLDLTLMNKDYKSLDPNELKKKYGYQKSHKILLFIGRLTKEKRPLDMVEIFNELYKEDQEYRLLIVGTGELSDELIDKIKEYKISNEVKIIDKIPNAHIWELYRIANCFVNLNLKEIFGMAILEAMYYECKVVAWKAPGPQLIIENGISGYLVESKCEMIERIKDNEKIGKEAHSRVVSAFNWGITSEIIKNIVNR